MTGASSSQIESIQDRPGHLSDEVELIRAVGNTFAALDVALEELAIPRLRTLAEMRLTGR